MIVALMVTAGCVLVVSGIYAAFGVPAALVAAGLAMFAGAWLAEQALG